MACIVFSATAQTPKPGDVKVNPKDGLKYVWVPPGKFTQGCSPGDKECFEDESPTRDITLTRGFWLGQTEVTQAAYQKITNDNPSVFEGPNLPVDMVESVDISNAIAWLVSDDARYVTGIILPVDAGFSNKK